MIMEMPMRTFSLGTPLYINNTHITHLIDQAGKSWYHVGKAFQGLGIDRAKAFSYIVGTLDLSQEEAEHQMLRDPRHGAKLLDGAHIDIVISHIPDTNVRTAIAKQWRQQRPRPEEDQHEIDLQPPQEAPERPQLPDGMEPSNCNQETDMQSEQPYDDADFREVEETNVVEFEPASSAGSSESYAKDRVHRFRDHDIVSIRDRDGNPWFIARQIAEMLGYKRPKDAVSSHCKNTQILKSGETPLLDLGFEVGPRGIQIINQGDVNRLIGRAKTPEAEAIQDWWYDEVLPSYMHGTAVVEAPETPQTTFAIAHDQLSGEDVELLSQMRSARDRWRREGAVKANEEIQRERDAIARALENQKSHQDRLAKALLARSADLEQTAKLIRAGELPSNECDALEAAE